MPRPRDYAQQFNRLNEMPWMTIACKITDGVNRQDERLESANTMMRVGQLHDFVRRWRAECASVDKLIQWQLFPPESGAKTLADFSGVRGPSSVAVHAVVQPVAKSDVCSMQHHFSCHIMCSTGPGEGHVCHVMCFLQYQCHRVDRKTQASLLTQALPPLSS